MRLWHELLLPYLPRQQLLGQHRECCALRGKGWGKPHSTVNYVFDHPYEWLVLYHYEIIKEMDKRGYNVDVKWLNPDYRGKELGFKQCNSIKLQVRSRNRGPYESIYPEHNAKYLQECLENLKSKSINIEM